MGPLNGRRREGEREDHAAAVTTTKHSGQSRCPTGRTGELTQQAPDGCAAFDTTSAQKQPPHGDPIEAAEAEAGDEEAAACCALCCIMRAIPPLGHPHGAVRDANERASSPR
jgi:hypothetical protein